MTHDTPTPGWREANMDDDIATTRVPLVVKIAAGSLALAGLVIGVLALQLWLFVDMGVVIPLALLLLAASTLTVAYYLGAGRGPAAVAGVVASVVSFLATGGVFVYLVVVGAYSLLAFMTPGLVILPLILTPLAVGPCQKIENARRRLQSAGLQLGY
jgi:hypothetical protein